MVERKNRWQGWTVACASAALVLASGCAYLNDNGQADDDRFALICGILGLIAFFAGVGGRRKSAALTFMGVVLVLA